MSSRVYQGALDAALKSATLPRNVLAQIIKKKLISLGVRFNKKQYSKLVDQLDGIEISGHITFLLSKKQIRASNFSSKADLKEAVRLTLSDLAADVDKYSENFSAVLPNVIQDVLEKSSGTLYKQLKKTRKHAIFDHQASQFNFERNLEYTWGEAFEALETLIGVARESGELYIQGLPKIESDYAGLISDVSVAIHVRCCQIAGEILALLKTGFADGAYARWRSLHEVSVVGLFIHEHDAELAERYWLHQDIETLRNLEGQLQRFPYLENNEEIQSSLDELKQAEKELLARFGRDYGTEYGWASKALNNNKPTFRDIEAAVNMDFLRPYYKLASMNIHASSKGAFYRIGLVEEHEPRLLAGRSNVGFEDPGILAGVSLSQITIALLAHEPDMDQLVFSKVMIHLQEETIRKFKRSARKLAKAIKEEAIAMSNSKLTETGKCKKSRRRNDAK